MTKRRSKSISAAGGSGAPEPLREDSSGGPGADGERVIDVLLVDDEALVRVGLRAIIDSQPDLRVVGEAADGVDVVPLVRASRPDVVVMDVRMPGIDGIEATRRLLTGSPDPPRVLVLTTFENDDHVYEALRVGAQGFLLKRAAPEEILRAVRTVAAGDSLLFPAAVRSLVARRETPARGAPRLTPRETEVLRLLAAGLNNAEIAGRLFLGVETVKTHVRAVLVKLDARDRTQAVIAAYETGLVRPS
ncbi:DNA-binding NarL/FixJ family response regulator [Actinoalloteichus hoggarensis]|uniref:Transcriptional regulatory protein LiaR n=1 Tax=Actinoalloteichus hoggarensis TaxID=1470176 RepID=A0A221W0R5_9PSEU|nr:response regulator transcription factor [Actinoalloteichus hoggarensis]ASO19357.1 Transcriptional regulatory protein LiaR [Actinoalloteichus hoggarensis]MBB5920595.1 DNA-binding NarL/FixJ family response regulator [Actinoalloteichus hoggarensis]